MLWQATVEMFPASFDVLVFPFITAQNEMFVLALLSSYIGEVTMR